MNIPLNFNNTESRLNQLYNNNNSAALRRRSPAGCMSHITGVLREAARSREDFNTVVLFKH